MAERKLKEVGMRRKVTGVILFLSCGHSDLGTLFSKCLMKYTAEYLEGGVEGAISNPKEQDFCWFALLCSSLGFRYFEIHRPSSLLMCYLGIHPKFFHACLPCQEVYSTVGEPTGRVSFTLVSWQ